jgi:hypothetical protein
MARFFQKSNRQWRYVCAGWLGPGAGMDPCLSFTLGSSKYHRLLRMPLPRAGLSKIHHSGAKVCSGSSLSKTCFDRDKCPVWLASSKSQRFRRHVFSSSVAEK